VVKNKNVKDIFFINVWRKKVFDIHFTEDEDDVSGNQNNCYWPLHNESIARCKHHMQEKLVYCCTYLENSYILVLIWPTCNFQCKVTYIQIANTSISLLWRNSLKESHDRFVHNSLKYLWHFCFWPLIFIHFHYMKIHRL
jgi:hypothetical protein